MQHMRQPTRFTLARATDLGQVMAQTEPRIVPSLHDAHQYFDYAGFVQAHRHRLEQHPAFDPWDARLNAIAEREGRLLGFVLDERREWDELHTSIATPIRCAFWYGWETFHELKKRYDHHIREIQARYQQVQVVHARDSVGMPRVTQERIAPEPGDILLDYLYGSMLDLESLPSAPPGSEPPNAG